MPLYIRKAFIGSKLLYFSFTWTSIMRRVCALIYTEVHVNISFM